MALSAIPEQITYDRLRNDPGVGVQDLQAALNVWFQEASSRDLSRVLDVIRKHQVTWKTAPKAGFFNRQSHLG